MYVAKVSLFLRPHLQTTAQVLSFNLAQLSETFSTHSQFLKEAHAFPLPNFPGHTQEALLQQLLRKKLEPRGEEWIDTYSKDAGEGLKTQELKELWGWAGKTSNGIVGPMLDEEGAFQDDFTIAEKEEGIENVVTGLRRKMWESDDEDEDEDGDDDKMEDVMPSSNGKDKEDAAEEGFDTSLPPLPLESVLRLVTTGRLPNGTGRTTT